MGRPVERGYYWHDDDVVIVDIGVPTDPLNRTTDEHGNYLQILCWGELRAGKLLVYPVVDDGRWGERIERPKDSRTGADRAPDRYMATGRGELRSRGFDWAAITTQWRESGLIQVRANDPKKQVTMPTAMPGDVPGARPEMLRFTRKAMFDLGVYGSAVDGE